MDVRGQVEIDRRLIALDGTPDKSRLGANAVLGASIAVARAAAAVADLPLFRYLADGRAPKLPVPMFNVINGGVHAGNLLDVQECMIVPIGAPNFREGLRWSAETFHALRARLKRAGESVSVGDEGGFAPQLRTVEEALATITAAIGDAGYRAGKDVALALDPAASQWHQGGRYVFEKSGAPSRTIQEMIQWYASLIDQFPVVSIEDGLAEDDWPGWRDLTRAIGKRCMLVGDDIFVTSARAIRAGVEQGVANAALIKPNQIGTLTETREAIAAARAASYRIVISHRSGETEDPFIADLAVAVGADFIKTGSLARSERLAKYNQLLRIEEQLS